MKRTMLRGALVLLLVALCAGARPQGDFALEYRAVKNVQNNPFPVLSRWLTAEDVGRLRLPDKLRGKSIRAITVPSAAGDVLMVITVEKTARLYIDPDRDGDLSDAKAVPGRDVEDGRCFGPVDIPVPESQGRLATRFNVHARIFTRVMEETEYRSVIGASVHPAGYRTGQVKLGGSACRIALVDADLDGRFNKACDAFDGAYPKLKADCFAIDLNNDGRFDQSRELCPLTKVIRVRGACYSLAVLPDGSKVRLERVAPEFQFGQLDVGSEGVEMVLFSPGLGLVSLGGAKAKWRLPTGTYTLMFSRIVRSDERGVRWAVTRRFPGRMCPTYDIKQGEVKAVKMGPPFSLETFPVWPHRSPDEYRMSFRILGQGKEEYEGIVEKDGRKLGPPRLRLIDEQGKMLGTASLEKGQRETLLYRWRIPKGFAGKFRIEVGVDLGPFSVTAKETWHTPDRTPD